MIFKVSKACYGLGLRAGAIVFRGIEIGDSSPELSGEIEKEVRRIQVRHEDSKLVRTLEEIKVLHDILRSVGVNPRRIQPSNQRLLEMACKKGVLPSINSLVDTYNLISIQTRASMGAHDLGSLSLPVSLTKTTGEESFVPLGMTEEHPVPAGEFGYVDADNRMICRLDVRQANFSKVTASSRDVLLIIEANTAFTEEAIRQTFDTSISRITSICGGEAEIVWYPEPVET